MYLFIYNIEKFIEKNNEYKNLEKKQIPYNDLIPTDCYKYYKMTDIHKNIELIFNKNNYNVNI
jgi:hypothetical protein